MWTPRRVFVLIASLAAFAVSAGASASPPSDQLPLGPSSLPSCTASAPDTQGAHICWVTLLRGGWQASTGHPLDPLPYLEAWDHSGAAAS